MINVASILNKIYNLYEFTSFSYIVRENDGYVDHVEFSQGPTFADSQNAVERLDGKNFDKDNQILYTLLCISVTNCGLIYCEKHKTKKNG